MTVDDAEAISAKRKDRRQRRLRQVLVELDREPAGLPWNQVWQRVIAAVPVTEADLEQTSTGKPKGEIDVQFYLQHLDKSGWMLTGVSPLRITRAGRRALQDMGEAEAFSVAAADGYRQWDALRKPPPEPETPQRRFL